MDDIRARAQWVKLQFLDRGRRGDSESRGLVRNGGADSHRSSPNIAIPRQ